MHGSMMAATTVFIPRFNSTVTVPSVKHAIRESVKELGHELPTQDQEEVVLKFVSGRDVFVSLPTGSGKSVCFACVSMVFDKLRGLNQSSSITVVVSPLHALMEDQVTKFTSRGLQAAYVSG